MGLTQVAFNFMVKNDKGKLIKSPLFFLKTPKTPINIGDFKYKPLNSDKLEISKLSCGLDTTSNACKFFGVDSLENLINKIKNHGKLTKIMEKRGTYSGCNTNIENFEQNFFDIGKYDRKTGCMFPPCSTFVQPHTINAGGIRGAKVTFLSGFNFKGQEWMHSVGLIQDYSGRLFILDSLGNQTKELKKFHERIGKIISEGSEKRNRNFVFKVICNSKPQQLENELTCNNWTYANLEALKNAMKNGSIRTVEELDSILPRDINKILKEQMQLIQNS